MASPVRGGPCTAPCCAGIEAQRELIIQSLRTAALYEIALQERNAKKARVESPPASSEPPPELAAPLPLNLLEGALYLEPI